MSDSNAIQSDWKNEAIVAPTRVWTRDEMEVTRRGLLPGSMDEKWFAFMEGDTLLLHRSWTGHGVYEATFEPSGDGHLIVSATCTGEHDRYSGNLESVGTRCWNGLSQS